MKSDRSILHKYVIPGLLALCMAHAPAAFAVATGTIRVQVPSTGQTSLKLFDAGGAEVPSVQGDPNRFSNLSPGTYRLRTERMGKTSETRVTVKENETCTVRVDDKGESELLRCLPVALVGQDQRALRLGLLMGWKQTPYDGRLNTTFGSGSADLQDDGSSFGIEAVYLLPPNGPDAPRPFLYGLFQAYSGIDEERLFIDAHPLPLTDTGLKMREYFTLALGVGMRRMLPRGSAVEGIVGIHATRVTASIITRESEGGGTDLRFSNSKTMVGPMVGVGVTYPLGRSPNGYPIDLVLRYMGLWMNDLNVSGSSNFSGGNYEGRIDGGLQHNISLGVRIPF